MTYGIAPECDLGLCNTILEHLCPILCDFLRDLEQKKYKILENITVGG